ADGAGGTAFADNAWNGSSTEKEANSHPLCALRRSTNQVANDLVNTQAPGVSLGPAASAGVVARPEREEGAPCSALFGARGRARRRGRKEESRPVLDSPPSGPSSVGGPRTTIPA